MIVEAIVFIVCMIGSSYQAYKIGLRLGAEHTIDHLHTAKIIAYDHKGNIVPNKFFDV
jgi:hypothetical protein